MNIEQAKTIIENWRKREITNIEAAKALTGKTLEPSNSKKALSAVDAFLNKITVENARAGQTLNLEIHKDGSQKHAKLLELHKLEDKSHYNILKQVGYDPAAWELQKARFSAWQVLSNELGINDLIGVEVVAKPIDGQLSTQSIQDVFTQMKPKKLPKYKYSGKGNILFELPIMDLHLGKLAWRDETGQDYDLKIASELYLKVIQDLVSRIDPSNIKKILFPIGQDFYHVDNDKNETNRGTSQDVDGRWQKMYQKGCEITTQAIESLRQIAPVEVAYIWGNHDVQMSYYLVNHLNAWFRDMDSVTVDLSPAPRKYYEFGNCMIGMSHGAENKKTLDKIMQAEAPEMWGRTKFRELHMGHLHSEHVHEFLGFKARRISSVTATDCWHNTSGYISVVRQAQAFCWHQQNGLQQILNSTISHVEER